MIVNSEEELRAALKDRFGDPVVIVGKRIELDERLYIQRDVELYGENKLICRKGILIKPPSSDRFINSVTVEKVYVENPGPDGQGDGIEVRGTYASPLQEVMLRNITCGPCGDEQLSIRGSEHTLVKGWFPEAGKKSHRGFYVGLTDDGKEPDARWELYIEESVLEAGKRLPLTRIDTYVTDCEIRKWRSDCAKPVGEGRIHYLDCTFYARDVPLHTRLLDKLSKWLPFLRDDRLHVIGNDPDNNRDVKQENCAFHGCSFE